MRYLSFLTFCLITMLMACQQEKPVKKEIKDFKSGIESVKGIRYTEVKRRFSNGLSFDTTGFQQEPSWIIEFYSADTVLAWDPAQQKMQGFHLHHDHKDVYNFAKEWFRFKSVSKDSLVFQRLQVTSKAIADDIRSDVNMTFYADSYIKKLSSSAEVLQRPSKADTTFIKQMIERAERNPTNADSVFAGRIPVQLIPRDNRIQVQKISTVDKLNGRTEAYDYLYPRFRIIIPDSYKDFGFEFNVLVDSNGKMHLGKFYMNMPEYKESRKKVLQGIIDVYLTSLLIIKPGTTLGLPHSSEITVSVKGKK
ncbi:hypothetical protein [Pedobacter antarcticus]|uniref:Uncharacterized protein n=2 Tax=Pedobacter antarcticus TaxID=34086 RepID=A0A081PGB3_9SPHI|nr:hypothetical protein [Pedobacter antarcticus]KEQ29736.1 hypothetical protein N180_05665 [Pedobacter antarcticus 4BY]